MTELKDDVYLTGAFKRVQYRPFGLDPIISVKEKEAKHGDHEIAFDLVDGDRKRSATL